MQQTFASFVRIVLDRKWVVLSIIIAVTIAAVEDGYAQRFVL